MLFSLLFAAAAAPLVRSHACPGYSATNVKTTFNGLIADLSLAGEPCNTYGIDLPDLVLQVEYQTDSRLHVIIHDANKTVYQVPDYVYPRPSVSDHDKPANTQLLFSYVSEPFGFAVSRLNGETLFNTSGSPLIFQSQYLGLRTSLPENPNLYGLGEHSDSFRLNTTDYTRTLWSSDAFSIPAGENLYGNQPIYFDHRGEKGTHGVVFVNSNGMDIKINRTEEDGQYLEFNTIGGVVDFYFVAGPTPLDVSSQIAEMVGLPAMMPYWSFGFHNCRYGYQDVFEVAEVVSNYSQAGIPLETIWTDIDYMDDRADFSLDQNRYSLPKMRELIDYLHAHQQHYIVLVDPALAYRDYAPYNNGLEQDVFLKRNNGSLYKGVVWPGVAVFPDWFHPNTQEYWSNEFKTFFDPENGVDIDALWIDMNEASQFCDFPCDDPWKYAEEEGYPPPPPATRSSNPRYLPGFPEDFQPSTNSPKVKREESPVGSMMGLPNRDLLTPPYRIRNGFGELSAHTIRSDIVHYNGLVEYDTHNLHGTMICSGSYEAMLARKPHLRPLVIARSTFLGAGQYVGHWLGDNVATWVKYRASISGMLQFASLYQVPMVGSDVCGFTQNTTETLCQRWAMLGAFTPFFRNHNGDDVIRQEFYVWPSVTEAAVKTIDIRYKMLDYIYTALHTQTVTGAPMLNPMWFIYPHDSLAPAVEFQYFYGDSVLVSPVTEENATSVDIYLPDDIFYDFNDGFAPVRGNGSVMTLEDIDFTTIPLHVRGGTILPLRTESANTTTELRKKGFNIVVAPGLDGTATGRLYLDEGALLDQLYTSEIGFSYSNGTLDMYGSFNYSAGVSIETITLLGYGQAPASIEGAGRQYLEYDAQREVLRINATIPLIASARMHINNMIGASTDLDSVSSFQLFGFMGCSMFSPLWAISGLLAAAVMVRWLFTKRRSRSKDYAQLPQAEISYSDAKVSESRNHL